MNAWIPFVFMLIVFGCISPSLSQGTLVRSCRVLEQSGGRYDIDTTVKYSFNNGACFTISGENVIVSSVQGIASDLTITNTNTTHALPGFRVLGKGARIHNMKSLVLVNAMLEVQAENVAIDVETVISTPGAKFAEATGCRFVNANGLRLSKPLTMTLAATKLTGMLIQHSNDLLISRTSTIASGAVSNAVGYVLDNVQHVTADYLGVKDFVGVSASALGLHITNSAHIEIGVDVTSIQGAKASIVSISNSSDISVDAGGIPIEVGSTGPSDLKMFTISESSNVVVSGGRVQYVQFSGQNLYITHIHLCTNVTVEALYVENNFTEATNVYGVYAENTVGLFVTGTLFEIFGDDIHEAYGLYLQGGDVTAETNKFRMGGTEVSVGMYLNTSLDKIAFADNHIYVENTANVWSNIKTDVIPTCELGIAAEACYPVAKYPCCVASCLIDTNTARSCRNPVAFCDEIDYCNGKTAKCVVNNIKPKGTPCKNNTCSPPDTCSGLNGDASACVPYPGELCEDIPFQRNGVCTATGCICKSPDLIYPNCTMICGDGRCDKNEPCFSDCFPKCRAKECFPYPQNECCKDDCTWSRDLCRKGTGPCDPDDYCNGTSNNCPKDYIAGRERICELSPNACTPDARCNGTSIECSPLRFDPCGQPFCGDNECNNGETCATCFRDCESTCPPTPCPGTPECSGHGTCTEGSCYCNQGWTGAICADISQEVNVTHNETQTNIRANKVTFKVGLKRIYEIRPDESNDGLPYYTLGGREFNGTHEDLKSSERWNTSMTLPNNATLRFTSWLFKEATTVYFANTTVPLNNYTVKNLISIVEWGFANYQNRLVLEYDIGGENVDPDACVDTNLQTDENNNVIYFSYRSGEVALYCQLVRAIIADDRIKTAQFRISADNNLQVVLPHFWYNVDVDPNFSVLVDDSRNGYNRAGDKCKDNIKNKSVDGVLLAKIIVPIATVCLIAAIAVAVIYPRVHTWYKAKKGQEHLETTLDNAGSFAENPDTSFSSD